MRHLAPLVIAALLLVGCTKPAPPPDVRTALEAPERWVSIPVAEFERECPDFAKALADGTLTLPDPHTAFVSNVGLESFKVRIEKGVVKEAWRERPAE